MRRDGFVGTLANEPVSPPGRHAGDMVEFSLSQISDWSLSANGALYGNYTTRVMLPQVDDATRALLLQVLSEIQYPKTGRPLLLLAMPATSWNAVG